MGVKLAYHANCWGALGGNAVGVTSIGQLTYRTFGDVERAIAEIAAAGYDGIELFDGNLLDYEDRLDDLGELLKGAGLQLVAVYSGANFIFPDVAEEEMAKIARAAGAAARLGALHLVVGGGAKRLSGVGSSDIDLLAAALDEIVSLAGRVGLQAHYHPHLSTIAEGPAAIDAVFAKSRIGFCPDTAHLKAGGGDPVDLVRRHRDRIHYVHLKGLRDDPFEFTPLDAGDLDNGAVIQALSETKFDGWITAELDSWSDPLDGARRSHRFLTARLT